MTMVERVAAALVDTSRNDMECDLLLQAEAEIFARAAIEAMGQQTVEVQLLRDQNARLRRFLEIALDAYEDLNDDLVKDRNVGKPGHFVTAAREYLAR